MILTAKQQESQYLFSDYSFDPEIYDLAKKEFSEANSYIQINKKRYDNDTLDSIIYQMFKDLFDERHKDYICGAFTSWNPTKDTAGFYCDGMSIWRGRTEFFKCLEDFQNPARLLSFIVRNNKVEILTKTE